MNEKFPLPDLKLCEKLRFREGLRVLFLLANSLPAENPLVNGFLAPRQDKKSESGTDFFQVIEQRKKCEKWVVLSGAGREIRLMFP